MREFPQVRVRFLICGEKIQEVDEKTEIEGSDIRGVDDCPERIKNNKGLSEEGMPRCFENLEVAEEDCNDIKRPLRRLIGVLKDRADIVPEYENSVTSKYSFEITIYESDFLPEVTLSADIIEYLDFMHAEIVFDIKKLTE